MQSVQRSLCPLMCVCACLQQAVVMVTRAAVGGAGVGGDHLGVPVNDYTGG